MRPIGEERYAPTFESDTDERHSNTTLPSQTGKIDITFCCRALVSGVAQWLGCRTVAGGLSLIYA